MFPNFSQAYATDNCFGGFVAARENTMGILGRSDFQDLRFSKPRISILRALARIGVRAFPPKDAKGVADVFGTGNGLQIVNPVVVPDAVFVVDLKTIWNRAYKRLVDKAVHLLVDRPACSDGMEDVVSVNVDRFFVDPKFSLGSPNIGNEKTLKVWHISPFFLHQSLLSGRGTYHARKA